VSVKLNHLTYDNIIYTVTYPNMLSLSHETVCTVHHEGEYTDVKLRISLLSWSQTRTGN